MRAAVSAVVIGLAVASGLTGASCGGDDARDEPPAAASTMAISMPPTVTPTPTPEPFRDVRTALRAASQLIATGSSFERFQAEGQEADSTPLQGTLTLARFGQWSTAGFDGTFGSHEGTVSRFADGHDATYLCISGQGQEACLKMHFDATSPVPLPAAFGLGDWLATLADSPDLDAHPDGALIRGGLEGACFSFTVPGGDGRICVAPMGELLAFHLALGDEHLDLELAEARPAREEDLTPPFAVMELNGY